MNEDSLSVHFSNFSFRSVPEYRGASKVLLLPRGAALGGKNFNSPQEIQS